MSKPIVITTVISEQDALFQEDGKFLDEPRYSGYHEIDTLPDGTQRPGKAVYYKHEHVLPII